MTDKTMTCGKCGHTWEATDEAITACPKCAGSSESGKSGSCGCGGKKSCC